MNDQTLEQAERPTAQAPAQKLPYEPPKATFVPLKPEERLLGCGKNFCVDDCDSCSPGGNS